MDSETLALPDSDDLPDVRNPAFCHSCGELYELESGYTCRHCDKSYCEPCYPDPFDVCDYCKLDLGS